MHLLRTVTTKFSDYVNTPLSCIVVNLTTILSACLFFDGIIFHLIGIGLFTWCNLLSLQIGIDHDHYCFIILQHTNDYRDFLISQLLSRIFSSVARNNFVVAFNLWTNNQWIQYTILFYAVLQLNHLTVSDHFKWMIWKCS